MNTTNSHIPRITGLLVLEVRNSNPNGDPDRESSPRQRPDQKGEISPVSVKRKLRDLVERRNAEVWKTVTDGLTLPPGFEFDVMESRERGWKDLKAANEEQRINEAWEKTSSLLNDDCAGFKAKYWDARLFGNTFLEKAKEEKGIQTTIRCGVAHFGVGLSVAPVSIRFDTWTKKAPAEPGTTRGMAPMGFRIVEHGVYTVPFFVNPNMAEGDRGTGCTPQDVEIMLRLLPYAYPLNRSVVRSEVEAVHVHVFTHNNSLGSVSDFAVIDALIPRKKTDPDKPSSSLNDYTVPTWAEIKSQPIRAGAKKTFEQCGSYRDYALDGE
ncbi:MAG: CRISPR-associated protein [Verrucomicrobia bacterium]|nr:CRISPR-associated protein [Verrucomicrobiota bacterium]